MIELIDVGKSYLTRTGRRVLFEDINFTIAPGERIGMFGRNGAGKSTLIRLISGAEQPSKGIIRRSMSVSWPLAFSGGFQARLSGSDNLRFICRIYDVDYKSRVKYVQEFSELGRYLYEPVAIYSSGMRARLAFAISMVIDFDCLLIDEVAAVGDVNFRQKSREELFNKRKDRAMVIASHSVNYLRDNCNRFLLLRNQRIEHFDDFETAHQQYTLMMQESPGAAR